MAGAASAALFFRDRLPSKKDEQSLPGEPILSFVKTIVGWYWARSERLAMSPNLLVFTGLPGPENSNEDFLRLAGQGSGDVSSKC